MPAPLKNPAVPLDGTEKLLLLEVVLPAPLKNPAVPLDVWAKLGEKNKLIKREDKLSVMIKSLFFNIFLFHFLELIITGNKIVTIGRTQNKSTSPFTGIG